MCPSTKRQPPGKNRVDWKIEMTKILKKKNDFIQHAFLSFYKGAEIVLGTEKTVVTTGDNNFAFRS